MRCLSEVVTERGFAIEFSTKHNESNEQLDTIDKGLKVNFDFHD